jgi:MazG family protein
MQRKQSLLDALAIMRDLRQRCEWDAAQTHASLRPYLIEEAFELDDALRAGSADAMREELGDVLLQVLFHAVVAEEQGTFDIDDVAGSLVSKMERRHPHLFGSGERESWEKMKARHRERLGEGLPLALPALHRAHRLQDRAAGVGFDWPDTSGPLDKVAEELEEVRKELAAHPVRGDASDVTTHDASHTALEAELGDLLFAVVNLCRKAGVHASLALDAANAKFEERFDEMASLATERGLALGEMSLEEMDAVWEEVKKRGMSDARRGTREE